MVNVTKENFIEQSNDFLKHLPTAAFIAIDEEMTGISLPASSTPNTRGRAAKDETPGQRYAAELKQIPERYSIIQFGISLFHSTATDPVVVAASSTAAANGNGPNNSNTRTVEFKARRYNFYMFPDEKSSRGDVVLNPGAVHFLNQHHMSFDEWTKKGIHFCTQDEARDLLQQYMTSTRKAAEQAAAEENTAAPTLQDAYRPRIELRRTEDVDFFSRTMASVREWLDAALPQQHQQHIRLNHPGAPQQLQQQQQQPLEGTSLLLPECSAFMRRALYESIQQEYPSLVLENAGNGTSENGNGGGNRNQIRVWRLNEQEKAHRRLRLQRQAWENLILHKIGMTRIFAALTRVCSGLSLDRHSVLFAPSMEQVVAVATHNTDDEDQVVAASFVPSSPPQKQQQQQPHAVGRKIPIVVHNGFMDLCFLMTHFCQHQLPATLTECKALIRQHFPMVYDTKILSTETFAASPMSESASGPLMLGAITNTRLDGLFDRYGRVCGVQNSVQVVSSSSSFTNNHSGVPANDDQEHEAAYDAYMTGICFIGLINDIQLGIRIPLPGSADYHEDDDDESDDNNDRNHDEAGDNDSPADRGNNDHDDVYNDDDDDEEEGELDVSTIETETQKLVRVILAKAETAKTKNRNSSHDVRALFGRNKLFQISMYTMDLEEPMRDPLSRGMLGEAAFRISGFDPSVSTRDVVRCLLGLVDSRGRRVNFELIWIDDTTFVVAACWRPPLSVAAAAANARAAAGLAAVAAAARGGGIGGAAAAGAVNQNHGNASSNENEDNMTILREHGKIVYDTLTTRFSSDMIVNLNDYLDSLEAAASVASADTGKDASAASSWTSRIWGMFGYKSKRASAEETENGQDTRSNKRRRLG